MSVKYEIKKTKDGEQTIDLTGSWDGPLTYANALEWGITDDRIKTYISAREHLNPSEVTQVRFGRTYELGGQWHV